MHARLQCCAWVPVAGGCELDGAAGPPRVVCGACGGGEGGEPMHVCTCVQLRGGSTLSAKCAKQ